MKEEKMKRSVRCQPFKDIGEEGDADGSPKNSRTGVDEICKLAI